MLNKAILIGRFTRDPELRSTPQGVSTCSFSLAIASTVLHGEPRLNLFQNIFTRETLLPLREVFRRAAGTIRTVKKDMRLRLL